MAKILVVDDDLALADVLAFTLRRAGFEVMLTHDGPSALEVYASEQPDLIVLDWGLPHMDGLEVCVRVRAESAVPIIMLTVRKSDDDIVEALEAGADDYVAKPFSPRELVARIHAVLRRAGGEPEGVLRVGRLRLDTNRREACWDGAEAIHLTRLEMRLLQALMCNANQVMTAESLITRIWGPGGATRDMLKQVVYRLHNKLEAGPSAPALIENIPNTGYVLNIPDEDN